MPVLRPSGRGPTSGTFLFSGWLPVALAGTGGGAQLGGSASRWEHLLPIRHHFLPSRGRCLLLRDPRSHLMEARGSGHLWISPCLATPTDTCGCQQVLHSGSQQHVHGLELRHPGWRVTQVSYPSCRGAGHGLGGRDHGCIAHCGRYPQGRCQAKSMARDRRTLTTLADSKTVSAVPHPGQSLQSVQHPNYI